MSLANQLHVESLATAFDDVVNNNGNGDIVGGLERLGVLAMAKKQFEVSRRGGIEGTTSRLGTIPRWTYGHIIVNR